MRFQLRPSAILVSYVLPSLKKRTKKPTKEQLGRGTGKSHRFFHLLMVGIFYTTFDELSLVINVITSLTINAMNKR